MFEELEGVKSLDEINAIRSRYDLEPGIILDDQNDPNSSQLPLLVKDESVIYTESIEIDDSEVIDEEIIETEYIIEEHLDDSETERNLTKKQSQNKSDIEKLYQFKCHECNQEFTKMNLLSVHCKQEHNTKPQVECLCGKKLSTWKRLMDHKARHFKDENALKCAECNLHYKTAAAYEKHLEKKHGDNAEKFICSRE